MKAIRVNAFGGPEVMKLEEVPDPRPGTGEVVVRVRAAGVNPVDTYIRSGAYAAKPSLPYTPGSDAAGTVEALGEGVDGLEVGDRVYTAGTISGAYAELALCARSQVHSLPERATFPQGAAMGVPYGTACRALFWRGRGRPGETVLVHGATGGVGTAAVQLAHAAGMRVFGTGGTPDGRQLVKQLGAEQVFDHHAPDYLDRIREATGGVGVDLVLEMLANVNLGNDLGLLAMHGRVVVIGSRGPVTIDPRMTMGRDADILGMLLNAGTVEELASINALLGAGLANGTLSPVIGQEMPLADAPRAHQAVMEAAHQGKIVLVP